MYPWQTFILGLCEHLAWPFVVMVSVFLFKKDVTHLISIFSDKINNINKLKLGDVEIETMEKVLDEYPTNNEEDDDDTSLEMQFLDVWIQLEECIKQALVGENIQKNNIRNMLNVAFRSKLITNAERKVLKDMLRYRNFLVHCENVIIPDSELTFFISFLKSMIIKIKGEENAVQ